MPAIRLDIVALHEFGHSLGLAHNSDPASIMYPYYNANYDLNTFASDSAVDTFQALYSNPDASPWQDNLDGTDDGVVNISYSFMPDGVKLDSGKKNTLNATMDSIFGAGNWGSIFADALDRWASASNGKVAFVAHADGLYNFNVSGAAQNDSRFGDIRIGTHRFDGPGKTLAHTYYPPPNGATAAGDAHFDQAESWSLASGGFTGGGGGGGAGNLTLGDEFPVLALPVLPTPPVGGTGTTVSGASSGDPITDATGTGAAPTGVLILSVKETAVERHDTNLPILSIGAETVVDHFALMGSGAVFLDELGR